MRFIIWAFLVFSIAVAAPEQSSSAEIAAYINAAQRSVWVAAPVLRVKAVADALRIAKLERGLEIRLLTGVESVRDAGSYWWSLREAGASLRGVSIVRGFEVLIDQKIHLRGDLIGRVLAPGEARTITIERGAALTTRVASWERLWSLAQPLKGIL
jgi:phytoene dehydrogenase-like protein